MAVNFKLRTLFPMDQATDPMGRTWTGWDRSRSDGELWAVNRGRWALGSRARAERLATLSFEGLVRIVVEIEGFDEVEDSRRHQPKYAVRGRVLEPGDPLRDALVGRHVPRGRNPVSYVDTSDVDDMTSGERAVGPIGPRRTFLVTHNPEHSPMDETLYAADVAMTTAGKLVRGRWSTGVRNSLIVPGDRGVLVNPPSDAVLEQLWSQHVGRPVHTRSSPRRGWQLDPVRRKKVEDAAQDRLEEHYRIAGWIVGDTRNGNPFDAVAIKGGDLVYLEAKGTETLGKTVLVTTGEVQHAQDHRGQCVLGILSDIRFLPNGEVDPASGVFRIFAWEPDPHELTATGYSWDPDDKKQLRIKKRIKKML